jgi:hypothetical protein
VIILFIINILHKNMKIMYILLHICIMQIMNVCYVTRIQLTLVFLKDVMAKIANTLRFMILSHHTFSERCTDFSS